MQTGLGSCRVNRWPDPQALLVETAGNYAFLGDPQALEPADIKPHVQGFVTADEAFLPLLQDAFGDVIVWPRLIFVQRRPLVLPEDTQHDIRRLEAADVGHLRRLSPESQWIAKTWGGPEGLASSNCSWGAFVDGQLISVACTFFLGEMFEEIGVVTEPLYRGLGLSTACAAALCRDIWTRGHRPSWTTSPDNLASIRVAEKLGFTLDRHDQLFVVGISIPAA